MVNKSPSDFQYSIKSDNSIVNNTLNNTPINQPSSDLLPPLEIVSSGSPPITLHIDPDVLTTPRQPILPRFANTEDTDKTEDYKAPLHR
jgi:hypothetical protein